MSPGKKEMPSENFLLKWKSLHRNHSCLAQSFCWWGQAHLLWMGTYFRHCGRWVFCCCWDCICAAIQQQTGPWCVCFAKNPCIHRSQNVYYLVLLCAGNSRHVIPAPVGTCPAPPLHLCARGVCLRAVEIFRNEPRNLFPTFLINWKELKCWPLAF